MMAVVIKPVPNNNNNNIDIHKPQQDGNRDRYMVMKNVHNTYDNYAPAPILVGCQRFNWPPPAPPILFLPPQDKPYLERTCRITPRRGHPPLPTSIWSGTSWTILHLVMYLNLTAPSAPPPC